MADGEVTPADSLMLRRTVAMIAPLFVDFLARVPPATAEEPPLPRQGWGLDAHGWGVVLHHGRRSL